MKLILIIFVILNFLTLSTSFAAGIFRITNRSFGNLDSNDPSHASLITEINTMFDTMENQVNGQLTQFDASSYLSGTANATALASSGGTHDLANRFKYVYVSVGAGLAADLGGKSFTDLAKDSESVNSAKGLSGNMSLSLGVPGNFLNLPKVGGFQPENSKVYMSYSQYSKSVEDVSFDYLTYSLMGQYHFFGYRSALLGSVKWNGVDFTTGIKYSKIKVLYSKAFNQSVSEQITAPGNPTMNMNMSTTAQLGANASITTIPFEVSTSIGLLYFLDGFVGLATDLNYGSADSIISAPGNVTATETSNTLGTMSGDIEFDLGQQGKAQAMSSRYLLGLAFDLRLVSLTFQFNRNITNSAEALHLSLGAHF